MADRSPSVYGMGTDAQRRKSFYGPPLLGQSILICFTHCKTFKAALSFMGLHAVNFIFVSWQRFLDQIILLLYFV